jgi:hypothetical protein
MMGSVRPIKEPYILIYYFLLLLIYGYVMFPFLVLLRLLGNGCKQILLNFK